MKNEFKRMQKLAGIINESLMIDKLNLGDKYIPSFKISKQLEPNPEEIYDFGGGKFSQQFNVSKTTVIDKFDIPEENPKNLIHDLGEYISLPPKNLIHMGYSFYNFPTEGLKKTIDECLKPGGYLVVQDYNSNLKKLKSLFKEYKILYERIQGGDPEEEGDNGFYVIVFQK